MPPKLALLFGAIFAFTAFRSDRRRDIGDAKGLFWPSLWYIVVASHPIGYWLLQWGVPVPGASDDPTDGSLIDRSFFLLLTIVGLRVLSKRNFRWGPTLRLNPWLTAFVIYMAISILWSQYPFVSFKRYIKVIGSIVMAMVVLTNGRQLDSIFTVIRRCLYVHLPMSIICTRYFRNIGVSFDWNGTAESWQGISTSKNTLGQIAMLGVVYFFWEVRRNWPQYGWRNIHILYLLMALYLLKGGPGSVSMTSISVCAFAVFVFLRIQSLRARPWAVRPFVLTVFCFTLIIICFVVTHSLVMFSANSVFGEMITLLGRDITLTDRTNIWHDVYEAASGNPLLGVGFGGFWIGRLANIPWNSQMTWVLGQAHSGYVDTYLQLGFVGIFLLLAAILSALPRLFEALADDFDFSCFRITMFLTIIYIDMTESVYLRGDHHLWLILQVVLWSIPRFPKSAESAIQEKASVLRHESPANRKPRSVLVSSCGGNLEPIGDYHPSIRSWRPA